MPKRHLRHWLATNALPMNMRGSIILIQLHEHINSCVIQGLFDLTSHCQARWVQATLYPDLISSIFSHQRVDWRPTLGRRFTDRRTCTNSCIGCSTSAQSHSFIVVVLVHHRLYIYQGINYFRTTFNTFFWTRISYILSSNIYLFETIFMLMIYSVSNAKSPFLKTLQNANETPEMLFLISDLDECTNFISLCPGNIIVIILGSHDKLHIVAELARE